MSALFRQSHRIGFHEVDAGGRLFGGHVFQFFIDAYHSFLLSRGVDLREMMKAYRCPMVHIEADFTGMLQFAAELMVEIAEITIGKTSLTISYRIAEENDPAKVLCTGKTVHVFVDPATLQKRPPPEELVAIITRG